MRLINKAIEATLLALGLFAVAAAPARAACYLAQVGSFPVTSDGAHMVVQADVDGKKVQMTLDTGSPFTVISATAARLLGLQVHAAGNGLSVGGGGVSRVANIEQLYFSHFTLRNIGAVVVDKTDYDGRLGRDVLGGYDVEVDLAHNLVRLLQTSGCSDAQMIYWGGKSFAEAPLQGYNSFLDDYRTVLGLNGHDVLAVLDTDAPNTTVSTGAARAAGASDPTGVFGTVTLGDESAKNVRLEVADLGAYRRPYDADHAVTESNYAIIGGDFFRSHRVLISPSHRKVFFTYLGGPMFPAVSAAATGQ